MLYTRGEWKFFTRYISNVAQTWIFWWILFLQSDIFGLWLVVSKFLICCYLNDAMLIGCLSRFDRRWYNVIHITTCYIYISILYYRDLPYIGHQLYRTLCDWCGSTFFPNSNFCFWLYKFILRQCKKNVWIISSHKYILMFCYNKSVNKNAVSHVRHTFLGKIRYFNGLK